VTDSRRHAGYSVKHVMQLTLDMTDGVKHVMQLTLDMRDGVVQGITSKHVT